MNRSALFSKDQTQRFLLTRSWDESLPIACCVGLNPSTANAEKDDSTITYLIKVLRHHGYGTLRMLNLYSVVTSDPDKLRELYSDQRSNEIVRDSMMEDAKNIIFCWGDFSQAWFPSQKVIKKYGKIALCFGKTKLGNPKHPQGFCRRGAKPESVILQSFTS